MKSLVRILGPVVVVRAELLPDGAAHTDVYLWRGGELADADWEAAKRCPVVVAICGHGVVSKPDTSEIIARVTADEETFLWSSENRQTSFVRRERLLGLFAELAERKIVPARVCCIDADGEFTAGAAACAARFTAELRWRDLWRLTEGFSAVTQALVRRAALPVLGIFLLLLTGNMLLSQHFGKRRQLLQTQYDARQRLSADAARTDARQRKLLEAFAAPPAMARAVVCDRIALAVPGGIVLSALDVEPLEGRFEARKPLSRRETTAVVRGTAPAADEVSEFVRRLGESFGQVRLAGVEREREGINLIFSIEIGL